jgi:hypothetical protein
MSRCPHGLLPLPREDIGCVPCAEERGYKEATGEISKLAAQARLWIENAYAALPREDADTEKLLNELVGVIRGERLKPSKVEI